jgi:signal transduction histidine kinase/HAMP domain-containing protein
MAGKFWSSLRIRLLTLVLLAVLPALLLLARIGLIERQRAAKASQEEALRLVRSAAANQKQLIETSRQLLATLARLPEIRKHNSNCGQVVGAILKENPIYTNLGAATPDGDVFCSAAPTRTQINISDRRYFQNVLRTKNFSLGDYQIGRMTGKAVMVTAYPVMDDKHSVEAVIFAGIDLDWLSQLLADAKAPQGSNLTVVDHNGTILVRFPTPEAWRGKSVAGTPMATKGLLTSEGVTEGLELGGSQDLYAYSKLVGAKVTIWAGIPKDAALADQNRIFARNLIALTIVALVVLVTAWVGGNWSIVRPVKALIASTEQLGGGDLSARSQLAPTAGELGRLAATFNRMAESLDRLYRELQTLRDIDLGILSTLDLHGVLDILLEKIDRYLPNSITTVRIYNNKTAQLEPIAWRNIQLQDTKTPEGNWPRSVPHLVFERKAPLTILNIEREVTTDDREFLSRNGFVSYFGVPLTSNGDIIGVLSFYLREEHRFTDREIEFFTMLGGQTSIAINNSLLYERTRQQAAALEKSNKIKDEFLSVISHELRTPLNVIMGYTTMLKDSVLGEINSAQKDALGKIANRTGDLLSMINAILNVISIDARSATTESEEVDLAAFMDELKSDFSAIERTKEISLKWDYPANLPIMESDSKKLKTILQNLISNALKFTEQGTVTVSAYHDLEHERVKFQVTDTGVGIPEEFHNAIFEKFKQVDSSDTRSYEGIGLGLYIVKQFTQLLGGEVKVESASGKGSIFTVEIPVWETQGIELRDTDLRPHV